MLTLIPLQQQQYTMIEPITVKARNGNIVPKIIARSAPFGWPILFLNNRINL